MTHIGLMGMLAAARFMRLDSPLTVLSYPDRPAKLPLWLAQDAGLFTKVWIER